MDITGGPAGTAIVLIAVERDRSLAALLDAQGYAVIEPETGAQAIQWARTIHPDIIVLDAQLPDMSGLVACRLLRGDADVERHVPILVLSAERPTPEMRVNALSAGAWDFLRYPTDAELTVRIETFVNAKRGLDSAANIGPIAEPAGRILSRLALVRRARELGALMVRCRQAMGCIAFEIESDPASARLGSLVAQAARLSDVVGAMGPATFVIVAPATDGDGLVDLAQRVAGTVRTNAALLEQPPAVLTVHAGYEAASILTYQPVDPAVLIGRAVTAVRHGTPHLGLPWLRRHDDVGAVRSVVTSSALERSRTR